MDGCGQVFQGFSDLGKDFLFSFFWHNMESLNTGENDPRFGLSNWVDDDLVY